MMSLEEAEAKLAEVTALLLGAYPDYALHAWYSRKQRGVGGMVLYEGLFGSRIYCTEVNHSPPSEYRSNWDDAVYLGPVGRFLEKTEESPMNTGDGLIEGLIEAFGGEDGMELGSLMVELQRKTQEPS